MTDRPDHDLPPDWEEAPLTPHERFTAAGFRCQPGALRSAVRRSGLELAGDEPSEIFAGPPDGRILIALTLDAVGVVALVHLGDDRLDAQLRADLAALHGVVFAGAADLDGAGWDAALRVMAALALEGADVRELAAWGRAEGSALAEADLAPYWHRWAGCDVTRWDELARAPAFVCALRRAQ